MMEIALAAARKGGQVLMQKFGGRFSVAHKGEVDLVTDADRAAEEAIIRVIRGTFPRHDVLAEEGGYRRNGSSHLWIIDPLDGTTNYTHGFPWFAVSIALAVEEEVVLGVIYNPFHQELFSARRGGGAFLNDVQLRVSGEQDLGQALLATGFPYDRKTSEVNNYDHFVHFQAAAQGCRRAGAACLDLAYVAAGRLDGYWEMKLKPWDVAAGALLVEEAGGRVSDFDGGAFDVRKPEILATNGRLHEPMIQILQQGKRP